MLRVTEENLRQKGKPSPTVPWLPISTACVGTSAAAEDKEHRRISTNPRRDSKKRDVQSYFYTGLFHAVSKSSPFYSDGD